VTRTVIVGASAAGLATARGLRQFGYEEEVVLVGDEDHLPYDRPPLSKQVLSGDWAEEAIWMCTRAELDDQGIQLRTGIGANGVDVGARSLRLANGERLAFDDLVIATGVRPRLPASWAGIDGVSTLRTIDDVRRLRAALEDAADVVIIGAGFIGAEAAAVIRTMDRVMTVVDPLPLPMAGALPPPVAELVAAVHRENGVDLRCGVAVRELVCSDGRVTAVVLTDDTQLKADLVIVGLGATPNTEWLADSGLPLDNGIVCDQYCRVGEHVYAAGDVASWLNVRFRARMRVEHRLHAAEQGGYVARAIAERCAEPFAPIPFFWSDQFDLRIQAFGQLRPSDRLTVIDGSTEDRRFVATCVRDERVCAVLGVNMPKQTRAAQALIA
jgi:3-phenylpropionate/trans-cinnamate dioxygenase ferredoxin reductase component